ncbi:MAG: CvpA family protein [Planctomycetes bacterium]|nr:CvpA family protein [Planctomycetota bacterium]
MVKQFIIMLSFVLASILAIPLIAQESAETPDENKQGKEEWIQAGGLYLKEFDCKIEESKAKWEWSFMGEQDGRKSFMCQNKETGKCITFTVVTAPKDIVNGQEQFVKGFVSGSRKNYEKSDVKVESATYVPSEMPIKNCSWKIVTILAFQDGSRAKTINYFIFQKDVFLFSLSCGADETEDPFLLQVANALKFGEKQKVKSTPTASANTKEYENRSRAVSMVFVYFIVGLFFAGIGKLVNWLAKRHVINTSFAAFIGMVILLIIMVAIVINVIISSDKPVGDSFNQGELFGEQFGVFLIPAMIALYFANREKKDNNKNNVTRQ